MIAAGQLRRRITIEQPTDTQDTRGGPTQTWATFATRWASIEPLAGREGFLAQQVQASLSHRIRMRYVAGITPKMRLLFGTRYFQIESVLNHEERNREIELLCTEIVP